MWLGRCSLRQESVEEAKSNLPHLENSRAAEGHLNERLVGACKYRATSKNLDPTSCLASIGGFDIQDIIEASIHEEEMKLCRYSRVPPMTLDDTCWQDNLINVPTLGGSRYLSEAC